MNRSLIFQILLAGMLMISASPAYSGEPREYLDIVPTSGDSFWIIDERPDGDVITDVVVDGSLSSFLGKYPNKDGKKIYVFYAPGLSKEEVIVILKNGQEVIAEKKVQLSKSKRGLAVKPYIKEVYPKAVLEGEVLTVKGINFGNSMDSLKLYIANNSVIGAFSLSKIDDKGEQTATFMIPDTKGTNFLKEKKLVYKKAYAFVVVNSNTPDWMDSNGYYVDVVISSARGWFAAIAAVVTGVIFIVPLIMCVYNSRNNETKTSFLEIVLMDKKTNTYSLSKFQALWWTMIVVWSYLYLAIGKSYLVGTAEMPDINASLLGVIGISFSGLITARGLGNMYPKNDRASAPPRFADLFSENNQINLTRLQLFAFTIVGSLVFVCYSLDPDFFINGLPKIPVELNALMAVSQGGYLGGKLTGSVSVNYILPRRVKIEKAEDVIIFGTGFVENTKVIIQGIADYIDTKFINQNTISFKMPQKIIGSGTKQIVLTPPTGTSYVLDDCLEVIDVTVEKKLVHDAHGKQAMTILFRGVVLSDEPVSAFLDAERLVLRKQEANLYRLERPEGLALDSVVTITTKDASFAITTAVNEINDFKFA